MCHLQAQNDPFVLNKIFLVQTIIITLLLHYHQPIGPFHCAKIKKILTADPEL